MPAYRFPSHVGGLSKGIYIALDYWDVLAVSPDVRGPRGGIVFGYDTVKRYLTNSLFIPLVQRAWIGSTGVGSAELIRVVRDGADAGRSMMVALGGSVQRSA
jgi:hypothetical protein